MMNNEMINVTAELMNALNEARQIHSDDKIIELISRALSNEIVPSPVIAQLIDDVDDVCEMHEQLEKIDVTFAEQFALVNELCHVHSCDVQICEDEDNDECISWRSAL
jgi:hypothetical protein